MHHFAMHGIVSRAVLYMQQIKYTGINMIDIFVQCCDAVGWVAGRASGLYKTESWGAGMAICLG